jgi:hypothetical protein
LPPNANAGRRRIIQHADGYTGGMAQAEKLGQAGLVGWRSKIAERVAPAAAQRVPLSEDQARAIVGALFFALSAYYVISTCVRMARAGRD